MFVNNVAKNMLRWEWVISHIFYMLKIHMQRRDKKNWMCHVHRSNFGTIDIDPSSRLPPFFQYRDRPDQHLRFFVSTSKRLTIYFRMANKHGQLILLSYVLMMCGPFSPRDVDLPLHFKGISCTLSMSTCHFLMVPPSPAIGH